MADTAFFSPEVFVFLRQLKRHNDREWFAKNKARYQTSIVEPALSFISGFAPYLGRISPHFVADARPTGRPIISARRVPSQSLTNTRVCCGLFWNLTT